MSICLYLFKSSFIHYLPDCFHDNSTCNTIWRGHLSNRWTKVWCVIYLNRSSLSRLNRWRFRLFFGILTAAPALVQAFTFIAATTTAHPFLLENRRNHIEFIYISKEQILNYQPRSIHQIPYSKYISPQNSAYWMLFRAYTLLTPLIIE